MFNSKKIKELTDEVSKLKEIITSLEKKVYVLDNPFEFDIGDTVVWQNVLYGAAVITSNFKKGRILDRYWIYNNKHYSILTEDGIFKKDISERDLSK